MRGGPEYATRIKCVEPDGQPAMCGPYAGWGGPIATPIKYDIINV